MAMSFWTGGPQAYEDGLRRHFEALLQTLHDRCAECSDNKERQAIQHEITSMEAEHQRKLYEIGWLLF
jgi:hypothetical protein